jgi:hypothetical protein
LKSIEPRRIQDEDCLIQQDLFSLLAGGLQHELRTGLSLSRGRSVDQIALGALGAKINGRIATGQNVCHWFLKQAAW